MVAQQQRPRGERAGNQRLFYASICLLGVSDIIGAFVAWPQGPQTQAALRLISLAYMGAAAILFVCWALTRKR